MPTRYYACAIIGSGTDVDAYRPALADVVACPWRAVDGRGDSTSPAGWMLVLADVTDAQHATIKADARCKYLPLEDNQGNALPLTATLSQIQTAKRTALRTELEARHIPLADLTGTDTIRAVLQRIVRRLVMRQVLRDLDWAEGLDTLVSAIPVARRQAIAARLEERGYDTSVIVGTDTIREALRKLAAQARPINRTLVD